MKTYANYIKQPERRMVRHLADFAIRIGWSAVEEVAIPVWNGRADLIFQPRPNGQVWLIEAKQTITSNQDLREAVSQVIGYRPFVADIWAEITKTVVVAERIAPKVDTLPMANPHEVVVHTTAQLRQAMKNAERRIRADLPAIDSRQERREYLEAMCRRGKLASAYFGQSGRLSTDTLLEEVEYLKAQIGRIRPNNPAKQR